MGLLRKKYYSLLLVTLLSFIIVTGCSIAPAEKLSKKEPAVNLSENTQPEIKNKIDKQEEAVKEPVVVDKSEESEWPNKKELITINEGEEDLISYKLLDHQVLPFRTYIPDIPGVMNLNITPVDTVENYGVQLRDTRVRPDWYDYMHIIFFREEMTTEQLEKSTQKLLESYNLKVARPIEQSIPEWKTDSIFSWAEQGFYLRPEDSQWVRGMILIGQYETRYFYILNWFTESEADYYSIMINEWRWKNEQPLATNKKEE